MCWIREGWRSLNLTNTLLVCSMLLALMSFVVCIQQCIGMMVHMGWTSLHKQMYCCRSPQNPHALTSSWAESFLFAVWNDKCFPASGWRADSPQTSWHTSDIRSAVRSRISLWRIIGNPPVGLFRAWSVVDDLPQAHVAGMSGGCYPNFRQNYLHHGCSVGCRVEMFADCFTC